MSLLRPLALCGALLLGPAAQAGRPLLIEDAGVNEPGSGHVEAWFERTADGNRVWTVSPAYAPLPQLEIAAALAHAGQAPHTLGRLQVKWQINPPQDERCFHALVLAAAHERRPSASSQAFNAVMSCPIGPGALHLNAGANWPAQGGAAPFVGAAWEQPLGPVTAHIEWLAARRARPVFNLGLRTTLTAGGLQLDGSIGRSGGRTLFSVGIKQPF